MGPFACARLRRDLVFPRDVRSADFAAASPSFCLSSTTSSAMSAKVAEPGASESVSIKHSAMTEVGFYCYILVFKLFIDF